MWRCGSAEQRVRLGPSRHLCCSGRRYTNAHAHCYSYRDRDRNGNCNCHCQPYCHGDRDGDSQPDCHSIAIANGHAATNAHTQGGAVGKAAPNAFPPAVEIASRQNFTKRSTGP